MGRETCLYEYVQKFYFFLLVCYKAYQNGIGSEATLKSILESQYVHFKYNIILGIFNSLIWAC